MVRIVPILLAVVLGCCLAQGQTIYGYMTGDALNRTCRGNTETCKAYIAGVVDFLASETARRGEEATFQWCAPAGTSIQQDISVFQKYAAEHAGLLSRNAADLVSQSLVQAFPCPSRPI